MVKPLIIALIFCLLSFALFSQTTQVNLSGTVRDGTTGQTIPFASVSLRSTALNNKSVKGIISDIEGKFSVSVLPGDYALLISMMSYQDLSKNLVLKETTDLGTINLNEANKQLNEIKITAKKAVIVQKTDRIVMNVGSSVLAAGNTAYNILAMAPALQVSGGVISMQGKSNVVIFLDGKRLPGTTLENILSSIPGDHIDKIEIITNPSSRYDADASGGVIEIRTKRPDHTGWTAAVAGNASQGVRSGGGLNGSLNMRSKKLDLSLATGFTRFGHYEVGYDNRQLFKGLIPNGAFAQTKDIQQGYRQNVNFNGALNYNLDQHHMIGLSVDMLDAKADVNGRINSSTTLEDSLKNSGINVNNRNKLSFNNYNLIFSKKLDDLGSNLLAVVNYATYQSERNQLFKQYLLDNENSNQQIANQAGADFEIYTGSLEYIKKFRSATTFEAGGKYTYTKNSSFQLSGNDIDEGEEEIKDPSLLNLGYKEKLVAGYLNLNHKIGKLSVQAGLRVENTSYMVRTGIDSAYLNVFPNMRFDLQTSKHYITSIGYARNINRPAYDNLIPYTILLDNYTSRVGNPFLKPEYNNSITLYQSYKNYALSGVYTVTDNTISQMLYYDQESLQFTRKVDNFLKKRLMSLNLSVPLKIGDFLQSNNRISVFYQRLKFPDPLSISNIILRDKKYFTLATFNSMVISKTISLELAASYSSAYMEGIYDYGSYSNVSFGIKKDFWKNRAFLKLDVSDVFFENNKVMYTRTVPLLTESFSRNDTQRLRLSFRYNFGTTFQKVKSPKVQGNKEEVSRLGI